MHVIVYDFGTSSVKACLFKIGSKIEIIAKSTEAYGLYVLKNGGVEQDVEEWWQAICTSTRRLFCKADIRPEEVRGLAFCAQMQSVILVDNKGNALRRPMNFLDQRGVKEFGDCMGRGVVKISGCSLYKLARNLMVNYAGSVSVKDPVWKYKWVQNNEPEIFDKTYSWLDVNDYLVGRCTGRIVRTADSAFATFLYDTRKGKEGWNKGLLRMYGVRPEHLPPIVECTEQVGGLAEEAAIDLGLVAGTPVFAGGGDATFINIGAGCTKPGDTHIYVGTSGWVSTCLDRQTVDLGAMITGVLSAKRGYYNYYAELETAGKCLEWAADHLALDELGIYDKEPAANGTADKPADPIDRLLAAAAKVPAGANGVIFTPWLHGNRCPFEDAAAAGMFFNIKIGTSKNDLVRAVVEGVCYHLRWLLECEASKVPTSDPVRFVGGGALSPLMCQMLADITGRTVETIRNTQEVGATGTALVVAAGLKGVDVLDLSQQLVTVRHAYAPNPANREAYERNYRVFRKLYKTNAASFKRMNADA